MLAELIESMRRTERYIFDMPPPPDGPGAAAPVDEGEVTDLVTAHDHFWPTFTDGQILIATQDHGWHRDSHSDWTP
jgi:hypothetical protein